MSDIQFRCQSHRRRIRVSLVSGVGFSSGEIGDTDTTTVEVQFSGNVSSLDYTAGVTIKVNAVSQTINSGTRQADHRIVHYVIASAVDANDTITWEYDADLGYYQDDDGNDLNDISAQAATNYVGCHLYFDTAADAAWVGAV